MGRYLSPERKFIGNSSTPEGKFINPGGEIHQPRRGNSSTPEGEVGSIWRRGDQILYNPFL
jgi:hypothetical protein